jgi:N-acetylglutamate synthase and related acetyltransferases
VVIRKAGINDINELIKIRIAYLKEDYGNISLEQIEQLKKQLKEYYANHIDRDMIAYIAEENSEIISSVFLVVIEKPANPTFISGKIGNILNVYTKTEYRKKGIAGQLLKLAINDAREMKLSFLELKSTKAGYNLYKELGFEEERSGYIQMKFKL